eukprot:758768-Hanusia_phi.AAC.1
MADDGGGGVSRYSASRRREDMEERIKRRRRLRSAPHVYQWLYPQAANAVPVVPMQFAEPDFLTGYGVSPLNSAFSWRPSAVHVRPQRVVVPGPQVIVKTVRKLKHNWGTRRLARSSLLVCADDHVPPGMMIMWEAY